MITSFTDPGRRESVIETEFPLNANIELIAHTGGDSAVIDTGPESQDISEYIFSPGPEIIESVCNFLKIRGHQQATIESSERNT
jgi:hypothetical protein